MKAYLITIYTQKKSFKKAIRKHLTWTMQQAEIAGQVLQNHYKNAFYEIKEIEAPFNK